MLSSFLFRKHKTKSTDHAAAANCTAMTSSDTSLGLKTIAADASHDGSPRKPKCVKRALVVAAAAASSPPSPSSIEDCIIGEEEEKEEEEEAACWAPYGSRRGRCRWQRFPPPIPLLARTGNLAGRMPWVLQRIYGYDGRLEIREVRVKHHEYFRARRGDGRLVLQLMELEDDDDDRRSDNDKEIMEMRDVPSSLMASSPPEKEETTSSPWLVNVAMSTSTAEAMMPASLPEVMCGKERFDLEAGSRSLHRQLPVSRMRMVHG